MTIDDIKTLVASDESRTLELKKTKDGMHSACAFLNSSGGWLIIGITPKSLKIIGQEVTDNTKREIAQALSGIEPAVDVEVENPGVLPRQLTPDTMKNVHESYPYNELVAKALYHSTYLESWGTGVQRIVDACIEQCLPEPTWSINGAFITITFQRPKHNPNTTQVPDQLATSWQQVGTKLALSSSTVSLLIEKMDESCLSLKELIHLLGLNDVGKFRKNYLNPALADGAIERLYPDQPNHPRQKYRLTEAAKEWKKNQSQNQT